MSKQAYENALDLLSANIKNPLIHANVAKMIVEKKDQNVIQIGKSSFYLYDDYIDPYERLMADVSYCGLRITILPKTVKILSGKVENSAGNVGSGFSNSTLSTLDLSQQEIVLREGLDNSAGISITSFDSSFECGVSASCKHFKIELYDEDIIRTCRAYTIGPHPIIKMYKGEQLIQVVEGCTDELDKCFDNKHFTLIKRFGSAYVYSSSSLGNEQIPFVFERTQAETKGIESEIYAYVGRGIPQKVKTIDPKKIISQIQSSIKPEPLVLNENLRAKGLKAIKNYHR